MTRPAAAMTPMIQLFFSTCSAAPMETGPDDVEAPDDSADCVLVTVSVAVGMPVAVVTPLLVDSESDSIAQIQPTDSDTNTRADAREGAHGSVEVVATVTNEALLDSAATSADVLDISGRLSSLAVCANLKNTGRRIGDCNLDQQRKGRKDDGNLEEHVDEGMLVLKESETGQGQAREAKASLTNEREVG
ncbi:hypothetical protein KCU83_g635, partial [Aureobasidium melanogenum]